MANEKSKEDKHNRIISAAIKIFARKGFYHSRVSEIASEAGVADGTIYLYFKNKDDLLISLFEEKMNALIEICDRELSGIEEPLDKLERLIKMHLELIQTDRDLAEVLTVELRQSAKFMREYTPKPFLAYLKLYETIISEGQKKGVIRVDISPKVVSRAIFGAMDELALSWALTRKKPYDLSSATKELSSLFIDGIGAGETKKEA
ncbi:MAG: TetR/AcrR family transcriptional regulator C-terminal domain-containing protein [Myxococcota bacterium]